MQIFSVLIKLEVLYFAVKVKVIVNKQTSHSFSPLQLSCCFYFVKIQVMHGTMLILNLTYVFL